MADLEKITLRSADWRVRIDGDEAVFTADGDVYRFNDVISIGRRHYLLLDGHAVVAVDPIGTTRDTYAPLLIYAKQCLQDPDGSE